MEITEDTIEKYLTNKLSPGEKDIFEAELASNPDLQARTALESSAIDTIKKARVAELKARLNNVKIEPSPLVSTPVKIATTAVILGLIAFFFYPFKTEQKSNIAEIKSESKPKALPQASTESTREKQPQPHVNEVPAKVTVTVPATETVKKEQPTVEVLKPAINVIDPTQEFEHTNQTPTVIKSERDYVSPAQIVVENDSSDKNYTFHYKFHKGKLILYGTFDSSLYEILEINGAKKSVFLYYKEKFYVLDEHQVKIKMLEPIQDAVLIQKLNEYRNSKK